MVFGIKQINSILPDLNKATIIIAIRMNANIKDCIKLPVNDLLPAKKVILVPVNCTSYLCPNISSNSDCKVSIKAGSFSDPISFTLTDSLVYLPVVSTNSLNNS